ncbi:MAG: VIT1/CCC1 transporter family protein [Patescibacteria group bacterium]
MSDHFFPQATAADKKLGAAMKTKAALLNNQANAEYRLLEDAWHQRHAGRYLADMVFAANDGIITTFAVVAGAAGAGLSPIVVVILGFANLFGDGASMALGNYLGKKSEQQYVDRQREKELWEIKNLPEIERDEIRQIYRHKGFSGQELDRVVAVITSNPDVWADTMMREELHLVTTPDGSPAKHGVATFVAFALAGLIPLLPFFLTSIKSTATMVSIGLTAATLFGVGALRTKVSAAHWWRGGLEMLLVGGIAAVLAYGVGWAVERLVTVVF